MDLFTQSKKICELNFGDLFKFGNDCYFTYRFVELLKNVDGYLLYNIRRREYFVYTCLGRDIHSTTVYPLSQEELKKVSNL